MNDTARHFCWYEADIRGVCFSYSTVAKWHVEFKRGRFLRWHDVPCGRPSTWQRRNCEKSFDLWWVVDEFVAEFAVISTGITIICAFDSNGEFVGEKRYLWNGCCERCLTSRRHMALMRWHLYSIHQFNENR